MSENTSNPLPKKRHNADSPCEGQKPTLNSWLVVPNQGVKGWNRWAFLDILQKLLQNPPSSTTQAKYPFTWIRTKWTQSKGICCRTENFQVPGAISLWWAIIPTKDACEWLHKFLNLWKEMGVGTFWSKEALLCFLVWSLRWLLLSWDVAGLVLKNTSCSSLTHQVTAHPSCC